jgi:hypothetical protein
MRKPWIVVGVLVVATYVVSRLVARSGRLDWEEIFDRMPDTAPPKWMFNNVRAIRENTDRILERLEARATAGAA